MLTSHKYGAKLRKLFNKALLSKSGSYLCHRCSKNKLKRESYAQWRCRSCETIFAGAAYSPTSEAGELAFRLILEYQKTG